MSRLLSFTEPDWTAPGQSLIDWLDQVDRRLEEHSLDDIEVVRPLIDARGRAIHQLAELIQCGGSWPGERITAIQVRTERLRARLQEVREDASRDLSRIRRDRALAGSFAKVNGDSQVDCVG